VPKATIVNWLNAGWLDLAVGRISRESPTRCASAEMSSMISSRRRTTSSVLELARRVDEDARVLLAPWVPPAKSDLLANAPLPIAATPFLGRTSERAALSALVCDADVRVVTLTGVAGTGKTRLAVEVASAVVENFHDGVAFVALAR